MSGIRTSCSVMENSLDVGWDRGGNFPRSAMGCRSPASGDPRPKMIGHLPPDLEGLQMRRQ